MNLRSDGRIILQSITQKCTLGIGDNVICCTIFCRFYIDRGIIFIYKMPTKPLII